MVSSASTIEMFVRQSDYYALAERRLDLSDVILGGDVLILGERGSGARALVCALAHLCAASRKVCVLDFRGDWRDDPCVGAVLGWRRGAIAPFERGCGPITVWDYEGQAIPKRPIDLLRRIVGFDDLIIDSWLPTTYPFLENDCSRKIVASHFVLDELVAHKWGHIFALKMTDPDDIAYISTYCGQFVSTSTLEPGAALLLSPGHVGEVVRVVR